jgi:hypothetical protein
MSYSKVAQVSNPQATFGSSFLRYEMSNGFVIQVKTITTREFFNAPRLVKALQPGQSMVVTDKGIPSFIVTKAGKRPRKTRADLEREAAEVSSRKGAKVNFTRAIRELKQR